MRRRVPRLAEAAGGALALALSLVANYFAGLYANRVGGKLPSLGGDLLLSVLPRHDLTWVFVWGFAAFLGFLFAAGAAYELERAPYIAWMYALLVGVRAFFLILTPMGAPLGIIQPEGIALFQYVGKYLAFHNDLFFSAHTALPFLGFLVFRKAWVRLVLLGFSFLLAATVILCGIHYSIDVFAAFFITYGLYAGHRDVVEPAYARWRDGTPRAEGVA